MLEKANSKLPAIKIEANKCTQVHWCYNTIHESPTQTWTCFGSY